MRTWLKSCEIKDGGQEMTTNCKGVQVKIYGHYLAIIVNLSFLGCNLWFRSLAFKGRIILHSLAVFLAGTCFFLYSIKGLIMSVFS